MYVLLGKCPRGYQRAWISSVTVMVKSERNLHGAIPTRACAPGEQESSGLCSRYSSQLWDL